MGSEVAMAARINRILYPVAFSPGCERSVKFVEYLARKYQAELTVLHVTETSEQLFTMLEVSGAMSEQLRQEWLDQGRRRLDQFVKLNLLDLAPRIALREGRAGPEIVRYADEHGMDLIMMPTHGFSLLRRFVLGSVTARVLHDAHCAVWTGVHTEEPESLEALPVRHVLCGVDLRAASESTVRYAAGLAADFAADLTLAHASPIVIPPPEFCVENDLTKRFAREARQDLEALAQRVGVQARICVEPGEAPAVIRQAALDHRASLIVIARGAAAEGLGRLRSHSYGIINQAPCPVVSV
jgi:nucleotide-binding universal stress UspA family protein